MDLSILQAEFSLTQVLDRPVTGRIFFEGVIRENLDIGRPDQVQLIFERRILRKGANVTPGRFRTRVITQGVYPSLHVDYKATRIKQYHKEGRALRTETTINNTRDFDIGKRLHNFPHSGRSASEPTDVSSTSRGSATTARSASMAFTPSNVRVSSMTSAPPPCALATNGSTRSFMRWCSSGCYRMASRTMIYASGSSRCVVSARRRVPSPTTSAASGCEASFAESLALTATK